MNKGRLQYDMTRHRLREIERIIAERWGSVPETDDADIVFEQIADCLLGINRKRKGVWLDLDALADRVKVWCERWAPWASIIQCRDAAREALRRKRVDTADQCAERLRLSYEERTRLQITTIGAFDVNKRQRAKLRNQRKRIRDREQQARKRAERGAVPRREYLARSLTRTQPWNADGISRRTWERRGLPAHQKINGRGRRQHDDTSRHRPRAGRAADPRRQRASRPKRKEVAEREPAQTLATNAASQSPSIKEVMVGDPPTSVSIEIVGKEVESNDEG